jgi:hypothetical protein
VKERHSLLKLAAIASSVLLVGAFVSFRAGAFQGLIGTTSTKPAETESNSSADPAPAAQSTPSAVEPSRMMPGSKSMKITIVPPATSAPTTAPPAAPPSAAPQQRIITDFDILPSSKSIAPLIPPPAPAASQGSK